MSNAIHIPQVTRDPATADIDLELRVTELEQQNRALRETQSMLEASRFRYADLYDFAPIAYCTLDETGTIREINVAGAELLGYDRAFLIGKPLFAPAKPVDTTVYFDHLRTVFRLNQLCTTLLELRPRRRGNITAQLISRPCHDSRGDVIACRTAIVEIPSQLDPGPDLATRANEERVRDELLATVSHELRTPLAAMLMWSHILSTRGAEDPALLKRAVEAIQMSVRAQSKLVDDLLDLSRATMGKLRLELRPIELADVIEAAVLAAAPSAMSKDIALETDVDRNIGPVAGDAGRLQQVMGNLLSNAIKFTPKGGHVRVELAASGADAVVRVIDNGQGIDPRFLPHIFEAFRQQDRTTTRPHGGLGLGLAIVRELVELHGGTVSAHSEGRNRGARLTVVLPRVHAKTESERPLPMLEANLLAGVHILLVDDDNETREVLALMLRQHGAEVTAAANADQALDFIHRQQPHVLVSDLAMPGKDGWQLIREVRALDGPLGRTPAVALTARTGVTDRDSALLAGFQLHLAKPVEPDELVGVVARLAKQP